jgi:hypothetical protein
MSPLPNPRHERMVQFLAQGKTAAEAYELAGYKPNGSNACNMARKQHIRRRLTEINNKVAARTVVTAETLIDEAEEVRVRAMEINQLSAANTAIKGKGILTGKWVERAEIGSPGEWDALSDDELEQRITERMARFGFVRVDALVDFSPSETDAPSETG